MPDVRLIDVNTLPNYKCQVTATIGDRKGPAEMRFVFWQDIEKAPTIDAVPVVHGRWEGYWNGCYGRDQMRCTVCRFEIRYTDGFKYGKPKYCPNCGAKMDGGAE